MLLKMFVSLGFFNLKVSECGVHCSNVHKVSQVRSSWIFCFLRGCLYQQLGCFLLWEVDFYETFYLFWNVLNITCSQKRYYLAVMIIFGENFVTLTCWRKFCYTNISVSRCHTRQKTYRSQLFL